MEFRILGPLEVSHDGRPLALPGARQRELLALLLLHAGQVVSADRLMDALWGEAQPTAGATALRVRVSQLRKALRAGGEVVVTRPPGYTITVGRDGLDLHKFERLVDDAERALGAGDATEAVERAGEALALWRGSPLADFAYAPWAQAAIARLEELHAAAVELRVEGELALGRHGRLAGELQALVAEHPLRERLWGQLMLALYRDGRQADALAAYRTARARLVEEVGIEPGPALQQLEARILAQDPDLAAATPARAAPAAPAPARCVLSLSDRATPLAEQLARQAGFELLAVSLVREPGEIEAATRRLAAVRERTQARVAAFTSADPGADAIRLAAEQDVALLLADAGEFPPAALDGAVCDVALVGGGPVREAPGPVVVPFAGHVHDWSAVEIGAWLAGDQPLRLLGVADAGGRDASRLLASASLAVQRGMNRMAEPVLVPAGPDAVVAAAEEAAAVVIGLSDRLAREGIGAVRAQIARRAPCPVLLVRAGLRPGGLAPSRALTRFTWSGGG